MEEQGAYFPLTSLSEDEKMFRDAVAAFAKAEVAPKVHEMDVQQKMNPDLLSQCFDLGIMGIEIPPEYDGAGGSFFMACLAVEELAAVDPSLAVIVDVQNTLSINAFLRWGTEYQKEKYLFAPHQHLHILKSSLLLEIMNKLLKPELHQSSSIRLLDLPFRLLYFFLNFTQTYT
jgi:hypothetical protein